MLCIVLTTSGCFVYERRTVPSRVVVQEPAVGPAPPKLSPCCQRDTARAFIKARPTMITAASTTGAIRAEDTKSLSVLIKALLERH